MMRLYKRYVDYASRNPVLLVFLALLFILGGLPALKIHVRNNPSDWNPGGSLEMADKNEFIRHFGNDETMTLFLTFPDSASDSYRLAFLGDLGDSIKKIYGFEQVFSRNDLQFIAGQMGSAYQKKLERIYFNSVNPRADILYLKMRKCPDPDVSRPSLLDSLQKITGRIPPAIRSDLTGPGVIYNEIDRLSTRDSKWLLVTCYLLVFGLLYWRLRKFAYLLICSVLVLLSIWVAMSMFGWLDIPVNTITMVVPLLFIINFFSFAIHLVTKQSTDVKTYLDKKVPPIIVSALTNCIGFGSLMLSKIHVIWQFGLLTSLGIMAGLAVLLLIGTPLVILFIDVNERIEEPDWMNRLLDSYYARLTKGVSVFVVSLMLVAMVAGAVIFPSIKVDTDSIRFMKPDNKVRLSEEYIEKNHGSANLIDFLVDKKDGSVFTAPDWSVVSSVRQKLATLPFVKSVSAYDLWRPLVDRLRPVDSLKSADLSAGFLTRDGMHSRLSVELPAGTLKEMEGMLDRSKAAIAEVAGGTQVAIRPVGYLPVFIEQMNTIVSGMLENLSVALVLILIVMSAFVRNVKMGVITTAITVFPLCGIAILMHVLGISFDIATSVISSVVVGMIADDALHIIWSLKQKNGLYRQPANIVFADSVRTIVHPCTATSIMFAIGFVVLSGSRISSIVDFGILSTAVIVFAWVSDFIFFPALLRLLYPCRVASSLGGPA